MNDWTALGTWAAAVVATGALLGVHPAVVVAAGLGAGVGLILTPGLGRWPAIALSALMTFIAPLVAAWIVAERASSFAAPLPAKCVIACAIAMLGPVVLRALIEHAPQLVRAAVDRLAGGSGGGGK